MPEEPKKETKKEKEMIHKRIHAKLKKSGWKLATVALLAILIISMFTGGFKNFFSPSSMGKQKAAEEAISYINTNLLQAGTEATLESVSDEGSIYKVNLKVSNLEFNSYVTKDGKYLFPQGIDMTKEIEEVETPPATGAATVDCESTPKNEKPKVAVYYMSYCPYGVMAMQGIAPAIKLLKGKVDFEPHYVIYENYRGGGQDYCIDNGKLCSMHGIAELNEDVRQACVWKYDNTKFWDYTLCAMEECNIGNIEICWKTCAEKKGVNTAKIEKCLKEEAVALMTKEKELNDKLEVRGSPTIFINEAGYSGGRAPENFKQAICCGFSEEPKECDTALGTAAQTPTGGCG